MTRHLHVEAEGSMDAGGEDDLCQAEGDDRMVRTGTGEETGDEESIVEEGDIVTESRRAKLIARLRACTAGK